MKKKLKDVCSGFTKNIAQKELDDIDGDYKIFGASGLIKKINYYVSEVPYIGIVKDGSGVGRVNSYPARSSLIGTMQYIVPNDDIELNYLMYVLRSMNLGNLYRGAAIPHIYFKEYKEFELNLPSKEEQQKIAAHLDKIQSAIDNKTQQLSLLDEVVKSEFVEIFGENPVESGKWKVERLGDNAEIITGNTPSRADKDNYGDYIEWIKTDNITSNTYVTTASEFLSEKGAIKGRLVEKNSILMACIAGSLKSIGKVALTDRTVAFNQQINAVVPKNYNSLFLYILFKISKSHIENSVDMMLKGILSKSKLENLKFIVPPLDLQNQFAAFVQQIDKSKSVVKQQIADLQELLDTKMQEYFGE